MARIAMVNDDTVFLDMMASVLGDAGFETAIFKESDAALTGLKTDPPDLIILDIRMERPETGWTLLELLTLDQTLSSIPVIVCSAAILDLRAHEDWLAARGISVLPKPFNITDLYEQVKMTLGPGGAE